MTLLCIDAAGEQIGDVRQAYNKAKAAGDESLKKFFDEDLQKTLAAFEKQANKDKSGVWIGSRLSLFDIQLYNLIHSFDDEKTVQKALEQCPQLRAIHDNVEQTPAIKQWLAERPQTMF
jgi:glutathione S-transferase